MQPSAIGPVLARLLQATAPDLLSDLFTPGRVLTADVVSVFQDRAVLSFGRGVRLEVGLQTALQEGERVLVQVQPGKDGPVTDQQQIVLKVLGPAPKDLPQNADPAGLNAPTGQTTAATGQQPGNAPQVFWLPVPLPDGSRGWAQLQIQEDDSPKSRAKHGGPVHQVRIWWETPALGPVQGVLEALGSSLSAIFTAVAGDSRSSLEEHLPDLLGRLAAAGFPEARLGCRLPAPGQTVEPVRGGDNSRFDRRM